MKTPWKVQQGVFRIASIANSAKLVWIIDADGNTVIPWTGFDSVSHSRALKLARLIVRLVNAGSVEHKGL
jgi:hypothetical protein